MNFVDYPTTPFANLSNIPQTILVADKNILLVNGIIICNRGAQDIRFNLKKVRTQTTPVEIFYVNELEIKAYKTIDVLSALGLEIFLEFSVNPSISDSLVCFSNGYTQKFDCDVTYTRLNELPLAT